jgi:hypothetical protein
MPAPSTLQTIPDVTEDIETGSGSGLGSSRDNGIFDQIRANDGVYFGFGSETDGRRTAKGGCSATRSYRHKAVLSPVAKRRPSAALLNGPLDGLVGRHSTMPGKFVQLATNTI